MYQIGIEHYCTLIIHIILSIQRTIMQPFPLPNQQIQHPRISFTETFASSLQDKPQRYGLDRSLARGIMQNNSKLIVEQQKQTQIEGQVQFNKEDEMNKVIVDCRNRYNRVKRESIIVQSSIKRYRQEIQRLTQQNKNLIIYKVDTSMDLKKCQDTCEEGSYETQTAILRLDGYSQVQDRIKKDIMHYKKNIFDANLSFLKRKSQSKRYGDSSQRQKKISLRCKTLLHSIDGSLLKNRSKRNFGLQKMQQILTQKQQFIIKQKERQYKIHRSIIQGQNDKLSEQKSLMKILYTNKLVKGILFHKMKRLMKKYENIYNSFNIIKQNTSIVTAEELVQRFLQRDQTYGQLLESISKIEPKIQNLKEENKRMQEQRNKIEWHRGQIDEQYLKLKVEGENFGFKELEKLNEKIQMMNRYKYSWSNWALQTLSSFRALPKKEISNSYQSISTLIKDTLSLILKFVQKHKEEQEKSIVQQAFEKQIKKTKTKAEDILHRNIRIKTLGSDLIKEQEEEIQYDLVSEKDYMQMARKAVKKQYILKRKGKINNKY